MVDEIVDRLLTVVEGGDRAHDPCAEPTHSQHVLEVDRAEQRLAGTSTRGRRSLIVTLRSLAAQHVADAHSDLTERLHAARDYHHAFGP